VRRVAELRNIGSVMEARLGEVGLASESDLRRIGAVAAFGRLRHRFGKAVTLNARFAMDAALSDTDWREIGSERKQELRRAAALEISTPDPFAD
jgi:DNA transformation protein and related proteins